ncbi:DUF362 domain-containing protein [Limisalsivibrio acetivorans]|uniref:DUF362 domain-containing protein n=1 Tax=Limisalsivibrio acetivorans TaxID=1304888 RepID=UPI0003B36CC1|nr:DUF362 domain-containing protein [Limisalsivibrio acetivorans]
MSRVLIEGVDSYGSESLNRFIYDYLAPSAERLRKCSLILVKPNLLLAAPPDRAITTHPAVVDAVITELRKFTDAEIVLGDSPGANFKNYNIVLDKTCMTPVLEKHGIEAVRFESSAPSSREGRVYASIGDRADLIVNVCKLKTHSLTGLTLAVKNMFGLVPGTAKVGYHREHPVDSDLAANIYDLFTFFKGRMLNIMDGITAHEGDGPSRGRAKDTGIMAASDDAVALDIAVTRLLGFEEGFCLTNAAAVENGYDSSSIEVTAENVPEGSSIKRPISKMRNILPGFLKKYLAEQVYVKPVIIGEKCIKCRLCVKSCPVDAISEGELFSIDHDKCVECFCCHEVCESDAVGVKRSLLHRMFVK